MKIKFYYSDQNEHGTSFYEVDENHALEVNHQEWICIDDLLEEDHVTAIAFPSDAGDELIWQCHRCGKKMPKRMGDVNLKFHYYSNRSRNRGETF